MHHVRLPCRRPAVPVVVPAASSATAPAAPIAVPRRRARSRGVVPALAVALVTSGCGWVDSTGRQAGDGPPAVPVMLDQIAPGEALVLNEERSMRLDLTRTARIGDTHVWSESPLASGALESCEQVPGFRPELAVETLAEACTDPFACAFAFERETLDPTDGANADGEGEGDAAVEPDDVPDGEDVGSEGETVAFVVSAPTLRAPIGLRHELTVTTADGASGTSVYDFCLVAINEAPDALEDGPFVVVEGSTLVIGPDDENNLLANDTDDDDVGNAPLRVDIVPARPPSASDAFELREDGGFSYSYPDLGIRGSIVDSFEYVASDGASDSAPAIVRLTIVPRDLPPVLALPLRPLEARVGEPLEANLAAGFSDPEGETLVFSLTNDGLPPSGSLTLDEDGFLSGVPLPADIGDYDIRFVAGDGVRETEGRVALSIVEPPNAAPVHIVGTIGNIVLARNRFMTPRTAGFDDADGDTLTFELVGELPRGLRFDAATGTLSGRPTRASNVTGLRIVATDPAGASGSSIPFSIRVL